MKEYVQILSETPQLPVLCRASYMDTGQASVILLAGKLLSLPSRSSCERRSRKPAGRSWQRSRHTPALAVDLDGTLVKTDLLWEAVLVLLSKSRVRLCSAAMADKG